MTDDRQLRLRALDNDDFSRLAELIEIVFAGAPMPAQLRAIEEERADLGAGRGIGVFDDAELAGAGTMAGLEVSVPGGTLPMAAVLFIGVKPTHRRRGIMSQIVRHQLHTLHESGGEPLAGLTASESVIYGRFGYGAASFVAGFTVPRSRGALRAVPGGAGLRLRLVPTAESVAVCEAVQARQVGRRAGMLVREDRFGRFFAIDVDQWSEGHSALRTVIAERAGQAAGFARYRTRPEFSSNGVGTGYTDVREIYADDAAGFAALASYLVDLDLTGGARFYRQPVDSPLVHLLADLRAAEMRVRDALWLRLVDVDRALAGRTYATPADLVLEVTDELCPWNAGRWRLTGDEKSAECARTGEPADLALDVRELAAAYLGGTTLAALGEAALVTELRPGALTDASRAFATDLAPWLQWGI
jgi:predicted acetyltransferase